MSVKKYFNVLIIVLILSSILFLMNEPHKKSEDIDELQELQELKPEITSFSMFVDFDDDYFLEYFTSNISDDVFSYDIWSFNGAVRKKYHFEKHLSYSLRQHYNIYITELDNKYYLIENDYSYGLAGYEYVSSTIIKKIVDGQIVIVHNLLEKTTFNVSAIEGDIEQFEQGSLNNPIVYFDFNIEIDENKYIEILNQYYNSESIKTLLDN